MPGSSINRRPWIFAVVLALAASISRPVHADPFRVALRLEVDPDLAGCPSESDFADMVAGRLGTVPFDPAATVVLRVRFVRQGAGVLAQVSLAGEGVPPTVRELGGRECGPLASAMALTASLALDPFVTSATPAAPPVVTPGPVSPGEPMAAPGPPIVRPPASAWPAPVVANVPVFTAHVEALPPRPLPTHTGFHYGLSGQFSAGTLPGDGVAPGLAIPLAVQLESGFEPGIELSYFPWQSIDTRYGGVRAMRLHAAAVACHRWLMLFGCLGLGIGPLFGESRGVADEQSDVSMQALATARVGIQLRFAESAELRFSADLAAAMTRTTLVLAGEDAWTTSTFQPGFSATLWMGT